MTYVIMSLLLLVLSSPFGTIQSADEQLDGYCQVIYELTLSVCNDMDCKTPISFTRQLALLDTETGTTNIIPNTQNFVDYFVSPNSQLIAVTVVDIGLAETRIFELSGSHPLLQYAVADGLIKGWNSDSTKILLKDLSNNVGVYFTYDLFTGTSIYLLNEEPLNILSASWSLDGQAIALIADRFPFQQSEEDLNDVLYVVNEEDTQYRQESPSELNVNTFSWLSDGALAYTVCDSEWCKLIVTNRDGARKDFSGSYIILGASPIDPILLLLRYSDSSVELALLNTQTNQFTTLESNYLYPYVGDDYLVSWSPDGKYIAYINNDENDAMRLYVHELESETTRKINMELGDDASKAYWNPKSGELIFDGSTQTENLFFIYDPATNVIQQLPSPELEGYADSPRWVCS